MHSNSLYQHWYQVFEWFERIIDLPHLNSIKLGYRALSGRYNNSTCSLIMESDIDMNELIIDLPNLSSIISDGYSFYYPRSITLSSLILNNWMMNRYSKSSNSWSSSFILESPFQISRKYYHEYEWMNRCFKYSW